MKNYTSKRGPPYAGKIVSPVVYPNSGGAGGGRMLVYDRIADTVLALLGRWAYP